MALTKKKKSLLFCLRSFTVYYSIYQRTFLVDETSAKLEEILGN